MTSPLGLGGAAGLLAGSLLSAGMLHNDYYGGGYYDDHMSPADATYMGDNEDFPADADAFSSANDFDDGDFGGGGDFGGDF